jgi:hypothetical protein
MIGDDADLQSRAALVSPWPMMIEKSIVRIWASSLTHARPFFVPSVANRRTQWDDVDFRRGGDNMQRRGSLGSNQSIIQT